MDRSVRFGAGVAAVAVAGALVLGAAAGTAGTGRAAEGTAAQAPAGQAAARPAAVTTSRMEAPLRLALEGVEEGDGAVVTVRLAVRGRLAALPRLRVELPEGAVLAEGAADEAVELPAGGGDLVRTLRIRGLKGRPVTVTAEAVGRSSGARARATWPRVDDAPPAPAVRALPIAPVQVHGVRVDRAIPLTPATRREPAGD